MMTNYNERLYKVLSRLVRDTTLAYIASNTATTSSSADDAGKRYEWSMVEAKQALTSLTKELVAEAKPSKKHVGDEVAENRSYTGERLFNATIDEYHTNLLKALEEV